MSSGVIDTIKLNLNIVVDIGKDRPRGSEDTAMIGLSGVKDTTRAGLVVF